ncbi:MAG: transposase [Phormidium sp. BM_Day4_Bin.17]|nr:transposase [Phormidium sp. BM_Day4_Bin.17]UCJ13765.1 MAG: transposase [Phormidium sp. PBR-2020]
MASRAKKTYKYREGDEELKNLFIETLRRIAKERIVYVDESGFDDRLDPPYGYCHRSQRFRAQKLGHPGKRVSAISAWREGEVLAPMIVEGYTNSALVCDWIEQMLLPEMLPGQILILDNANMLLDCSGRK